MKIPVEIAFFHRGEFIENLLKFSPIWELKLANFSSGNKTYLFLVTCE